MQEYIIDYIKRNRKTKVFSCRIKNNDWDLYDIIKGNSLWEIMNKLNIAKQNIKSYRDINENPIFNF